MERIEVVAVQTKNVFKYDDDRIGNDEERQGWRKNR